jgi:ATP synthase protein I
MGIAYRLSVEMVAGLVVGGGVGWGFDLLFGTKPWFLVVFFLLGAAAGMLNAVRAARAIQAEADRAEEEARNARPERK